jgi:hypothetical protein
MEYLRDVSGFLHRFTLFISSCQVWINRLKTEDAIPPDRRTDFLAQVFWNVHDIIAVNTRLRDALNRRQKSYAVVDRIGDILLEVVPDFGPFVSYGAHQLYGKYEFEKEKASNTAFADFVEVSCSLSYHLFNNVKFFGLGCRTPSGIKKTGTKCLSHETYNTFSEISPLARSRSEAYTFG